MVYLLGWFVAAGTSVLAAFLAVPKELWSRWRARLVDRIDHSLRRRTTRFGQRYREYLLSTLRFIDLKGLATIGFYTPELDEVFVDVGLAYRAPHLVPEGVLSQVPQEVTDRRSLNEFLSYERPVTLAVLGGPGSGKTTLLRHTAQDFCRRKNAKIPVLLYLRDHVTTVVGSPSATLPELLRTTLGGHASDEPPGWFEQQLREGNCVILLDGLDEVARSDDRRRLSHWVERQTKQFPRNNFVITSRPQGYRSAPIDGAVVLQVRSFTEQQISRFVHGWYLAMERHSTGLSTDEIRTRAESASNDLLARLKDTPALDDLTVNPLLLTMIANVHRYRGALPGSRSDLYGEICQVMLWRRAEAKDMPLQLNGDKKESLLRGLAFTMMQQHVRDLPRADLLRELATALRRVSTALTEEAFLADATSNGLLIERESGVFSFAHLTFQEYLASAYIRDKGSIQVLTEMVDDIWWRETTLLYTAKSDADPIVRACLTSSSVTALMLAFDCVDQESELAPELHDELERILHAEETDPELARARVGLLVARHLRHYTRTSNGGRLCNRPITNSIYELFVADNPAHRLWEHSADGDLPVTGVHELAAKAFVRWANTITNGDPGYRLPWAAEISDQPVRRLLPKNVTIWTTPTTRLREAELWTPPGTDNPYSLSRDNLLRHVATDLSGNVIEKIRLVRSKVIVIALQLAFQQSREPYPDGLAGLGGRINDVLRKGTSLDHVLGLQDPFRNEPDVANIIRLDMRLIPAHCLRHSVGNILSHIAPGQNAGIAEHVERVYANARHIARDRADDLDDLIVNTCAQLMGRALSHAVGQALRTSSTGQPLHVRLADALLSVAGIVHQHILTSPEVPRTERPYIHENWLNPWSAEVTHTLDDSLFRLRTQLIRMENMTCIRFPALCLAGEMTPVTDQGPYGQFGKWARQLATSVTLLERRATGQAPAMETIMLATT